MGLRKYGTSEDQAILAEEGDLQKTAAPHDKEQVLAEVKAEGEAADADHEEG